PPRQTAQAAPRRTHRRDVATSRTGEFSASTFEENHLSIDTDIVDPVLIIQKRLDWRNSLQKFAYLLKGIDPSCKTFTRANGQGPSFEGTIQGKRCGTSSTLSSSKRRMAGYRDDAVMADLDFHDVIRHRQAALEAAPRAAVQAMLRQVSQRPAGLKADVAPHSFQDDRTAFPGLAEAGLSQTGDSALPALP
ncbi:hypothetical protein, partial [Paracraurococcus ruber]